MRTARVIAALLLAVVVAGCTPGVEVDAGAAVDTPAPSPAPTVTVTVTETVTAEPTSEPEPAPTVTVTATAAAAGDSSSDACADLTGGEQLAFVFVTSPTAGQAVTSGFDVSGCANTFEATYQWQLLGRDGTVLAEDFGTASCGSGCVGDVAFTVDYDVAERQVGTLRVFSTSAQDGSEQDVNSVPLILEP